jgi:hypothetical protein
VAAHAGAAAAVAFCHSAPHVVLSGGADAQLLWLDLTTGRPAHRVATASPVTALALKVRRRRRLPPPPPLCIRSKSESVSPCALTLQSKRRAPHASSRTDHRGAGSHAPLYRPQPIRRLLQVLVAELTRAAAVMVWCGGGGCVLVVQCDGVTLAVGGADGRTTLYDVRRLPSAATRPEGTHGTHGAVCTLGGAAPQPVTSLHWQGSADVQPVPLDGADDALLDTAERCVYRCGISSSTRAARDGLRVGLGTPVGRFRG